MGNSNPVQSRLQPVRPATQPVPPPQPSTQLPQQQTPTQRQLNSSILSSSLYFIPPTTTANANATGLNTNDIVAINIDNDNANTDEFVTWFFSRLRRNQWNFFEQSVPVVPSADDISNGSILYDYPENSGADRCSICQEEFVVNQQIRKLTFCNHVYHKGCIDVWFTRNPHCPICRHDIREPGTPAQTNSNH